MKRKLKEEIEKILNKGFENPYDSSIYTAGELLSLISKTLDDVIGEDEFPKNKESLNVIGSQNYLRRLQRARKKEFGL